MTAYLAFKILALVAPALFLSMNHNKAEKLTLLAVMLLWISEYLVKIIINRTVCSAKFANFLNTMFEIKIDKSKFKFSLSLEIHIITICLLQLIYSVIKRLQTNKMQRKTFYNNFAYTDVENGYNRTNVKSSDIKTLSAHLEKKNGNRFEKVSKTVDFLLPGTGDYLKKLI